MDDNPQGYELAAGLAHEVRNSLTTVRGLVQVSHETNTSNNDYYDLILEEIDRASGLLSEFLLLSKKKYSDYGLIDMDEFLDYGREFVSAALGAKEISLSIKRNIPDSLKIYGERKKLKQVFINICKNAIEAMPQRGKMEISVYMSGQNINLTVKDNGSGIDDLCMEKIVQPFFSTKSHGTGLGLYLSYKILKEHGGDLYIESEKGLGSKVTMSVPVYDEE